MNTFFINTSKKQWKEYGVLFDIDVESKKLVRMDCPLADWMDPEKGYKSCFRKMGEMIDGYVELNNAFDLIVYVDLLEVGSYADIQKTDDGEETRQTHASALKIAYSHLFQKTIVSALADYGRGPQEVLLMFGEEKPIRIDGAMESKPSQEKISDCLRQYLGMPKRRTDTPPDRAQNADAPQDRAQNADAPQEAETFCFVPAYTDDEIEKYRRDDRVDQFIKDTEANAERAGIKSVGCPYDSHACAVNKCARAADRLNIALHLLRCVFAGSIYQKKENSEEKEPIPFCSIGAAQMAARLGEREQAYAAKAEEVKQLKQKYSKLGLTPTLYAFDHAKFGLDKYGDVQTPLYKPNVEDEDFLLKVKGKGAREEVNGPSWEIGKNAKAQDYLERAAEIRECDKNFLKALDRYVRSTLSRYAGKSSENDEPLLASGEYEYAKKSGAGREEETGALEFTENVCEKAYDTVRTEYMQFSAARPLSVTDLEAPYERFKENVKRIEESLRRIGYAAIILLVMTLVLYVPFFIIQFEAIFANVLTMSVALCSLLVPVLLLYLIFGAVALAEKKRFAKEWAKYRTVWEKAMKGNRRAISQYRQWLFTMVPALRWVYDYRSDVRYYAECCAVADAKIEHHRCKLEERIAALRNIRSDLEELAAHEYEDPAKGAKAAGGSDGGEIEYGRPFCVGEKNRAFYAVIGQKFLESCTKAEVTK